MKKSLAFTLVEVLITLSVIAVVAAIVMPSFVNNTNDQENRTMFKKVYADLSAAIKRMRDDNGGTMKGFGKCTGNYDEEMGVWTGCDPSDYTNRFSEYFNFSKYCPNHNCGYTGFTRATYILSNGAAIYTPYDMDCNFTCNCTMGPNVSYCSIISIDVNNQRGPNKIGKDIFYAYITDDGLVPYGTDGDNTRCKLTADAPYDPADPDDPNAPSGVGCAAKVLKNEDYQ